MPVTYKKTDDWDKMFEKFAKFDELETVTFPEPNSDSDNESPAT